MSRVVVVLFALILASTARAADPPAKVVKDVPAFLAYQRELRDDLEHDRRYRHVDGDAKRELFEAQDVLFRLLDGKRSVDELPHEQQIEVFNAQTKVAAVLNDAELDRKVCRRERRIGSNMMQTVCETKRERRDRAEHSRELRLAPRGCDGGTGNEVCG